MPRTRRTKIEPIEEKAPPKVVESPVPHPKAYHLKKTAKFHPYTIFDSPEWVQSQFYGFYVLFWVAIFTYNSRILILNYMSTGRLLERQIVDTLTRDLLHVGITDLLMYFLTYEAYFLQKLVAMDVVSWRRFGWIFQHLYQTAFLAFFVFYARVVDFPWIGRIFLALHALVQMMKMHSYAVFNGELHDLKKTSESKTMIVTPAEVDLISVVRPVIEKYPSNVTFKDFFMYTMYPTVVYEMDFPRTDKIRWGFAIRKILATFGTFLCMIVISQQHLVPIVLRAEDLRVTDSFTSKLKQYPLIFLDVLPAFMIVYILTFYIIWDAILTSLAELTRYGDREFYRDWWNSYQWAKFARDWNVPVHNFLQRHVYTSSRLFLNLSKVQAMIFTFLFSSLIHELAMWVIFRRIRGYLLLMQLTQLPMQFLSQFGIFKNNRMLGLVLFWLGMALGPSIICSLYLTF